MTDVTWVGKATKVKANEGIKDGRKWESTSFTLEKPYVRDGETKYEKWFMDAWKKLPVEEGKMYWVGCNLVRRKKQNSEDWETRLQCEWVAPYESASEEEAYPSEGVASVGNEDDIPF